MLIKTFKKFTMKDSSEFYVSLNRIKEQKICKILKNLKKSIFCQTEKKIGVKVFLKNIDIKLQ